MQIEGQRAGIVVEGNRRMPIVMRGSQDRAHLAGRVRRGAHHHTRRQHRAAEERGDRSRGPPGR